MDIKEVYDRWQAGESISELSRETGIPYATMRYQLRKQCEAVGDDLPALPTPGPEPQGLSLISVRLPDEDISWLRKFRNPSEVIRKAIKSYRSK